ncbi:phosphotransferase enzyme family protein [Streptomyces sp. NPDC050485]|uniref:phosphotransferase enzyme family protein n=1 Tax=Streptomyces sp. NPDC050485 TaxID=3365617 RepID=UPI0037ACABEF
MTKAPAETAARHACRNAGLSDRSLIPLGNHATAVYLLREHQVVVRVSRAEHHERLATSIAVTRWLVDQGYPVTEPADLPQPVHQDGFAVTFWTHYPQPRTDRPAARHLGELLRALHDLPAPPVELPPFQPLASLFATLTDSTSLRPDQRAWLLQRRQQLLEAYRGLDFALGDGLLHGDAYPGNTLWDDQRVLLGDWDEVAIGPRELDLANTYQGIRFGRTQRELDEFGTAYGYDLRAWHGLPVLRRMRDLHTLGSYVRRADRGDEAAARQLAHRVETLRAGRDEACWSAAS